MTIAFGSERKDINSGNDLEHYQIQNKPLIKTLVKVTYYPETLNILI